MMKTSRIFAVFVCLTACSIGGCTRRPKILTPAVLDPHAAAVEALSEFDANGDGRIAGPELRNCPGLAAALPTTDRDKDGALTLDEVAARLGQYVETQSALLACRCVVTLDGRPLSGANVELVPEPFLEPIIEHARGTTDGNGRVDPKAEFEDAELKEQRLVGVRPGMYRIKISRQNSSGEELIPARYNTETELGLEPELTVPASTHRFDLSSRWR